MVTKRCTRKDCEQPVKPLDCFYDDKRAKDGKMSWCIDCLKKYYKELRARHTSNYDPNQDGTYKCPRCGKTRPYSHFGPCKSRHNGIQGYCRVCQAEIREEKRTEVLKVYSGEIPDCACCGEMQIRFLTIDHIDGKGHEHRRELKRQGKSYDIYVYLRQNNFPPGFQVLCWNCNCCKGKYGECAHRNPNSFMFPIDDAECIDSEQEESASTCLDI